jgi:hypothetical protein
MNLARILAFFFSAKTLKDAYTYAAFQPWLTGEVELLKPYPDELDGGGRVYKPPTWA